MPLNKINKITILFFLISILVVPRLVLPMYAQNNTIDSLNRLLKTATQDTTRASVLVCLSEEFGVSKPDTVIPLCQQVLAIIEKNLLTSNQKEKHSYLIAKSSALNNIGYIYNNQGDIPKALEYYQQSLKIKEEIGDKEGIAISLNNIAYIYFNQGNIHEALNFFIQSQNIREEIGDKKGLAESLNNIGYIYQNEGDIPKALDYFQQSLKINEEIGDKEGIAISLNNIGMIYKNQGDIPKALDYIQHCQKIQEEIDDKKGIARSLNNIGFIYSNQGNISKAFDYYQQSQKIEEEIGDKRGIATSLNNIGMIYMNQVDIPKVHPVVRDSLLNKALDCFQQSKKIREEIADKNGIANSLNNIAHIYNNQGDIPKALEYYQQSLKIKEEIGDNLGIAYSLNNIGGVYLKQKKYTLALSYSDSSLSIARELGFPENIRNAAELLSKIYFAKNDYKTGHSYYELYIQMRDSIFNEEKTKQITRLETRYEIEKQIEKQKREEEWEKRRAGEQVSRRNNIQLLGSFIVVIILLSGLILLGRFHVPVKVMEGFMFVSFILFYELIGVFADPYIENITGGAPALKLVINAVIAIVLYGLNSLVEGMIKGRLGRKL